MSPGSAPVRLASRGSPLARQQVRIVEELLAAAWGREIAVEVVVVETTGDRRQQVPIHAVGGEGVFVKEVELAVLEGRADVAVHSAKDLPASSLDGSQDQLEIIAVPPRGDPRDALVGRGLAELVAGAEVATGSVRRRAQLAWLRPDLRFCELRGNISTRLSKVPEGGAVVVAMAALERLGLAERAAEALSVTVMLPQVGQGAIAICARPGDERAATLFGRVEDKAARLTVDAERAYLSGIGGGCDMPVGAHATVSTDGRIELQAMIATLDGHAMVREHETGTDPAELGRELARRVLEESGGSEILRRAGTRGGTAP